MNLDRRLKFIFNYLIHTYHQLSITILWFDNFLKQSLVKLKMEVGIIFWKTNNGFFSVLKNYRYTHIYINIVINYKIISITTLKRPPLTLMIYVL